MGRSKLRVGLDGLRFLKVHVLMFWHTLGNRFVTLLSNITSDLNLTDMETCYKAFRAEVLKGLRLTSNRFGFEPEVTARLAQLKYRIYEAPIRYHGRDYTEGKKINWKDGVAAIWTIMKCAVTNQTGAHFEDAVAQVRGHRLVDPPVESPRLGKRHQRG